MVKKSFISPLFGVFIYDLVSPTAEHFQPCSWSNIGFVSTGLLIMSDLVIEASDYGHGGLIVVVVAAILILMQVFMVGGRLLGRRIQSVWLGIDDYVLISATVSDISISVIFYHS